MYLQFYALHFFSTLSLKYPEATEVFIDITMRAAASCSIRWWPLMAEHHHPCLHFPLLLMAHAYICFIELFFTIPVLEYFLY